MPVIHKVIPNLSVPNSPEDSVHNTFIDLSVELSKFYSKNIRQGNTFHVTGMQAAIIPSSGLTDDWDAGASCTIKHQYQSTTKYPRMAWNKTFKVWKEQSSSSASHTPIKYNDFEIGWDANAAYHDADRTSTIYSKGISDTDAEKVVMIGSSTSGSDFTLQDYVNSMMDAPSPSIDPFDSETLKEPKFTYNNRWPDASRQYISAFASNTFDDGDNDASGATANSELYEFPAPLKVMCGLFKVNVYIPMDDTLSSWADTFDLILSYHIKKWTPLVYRPKSIKSRKSSRRATRGKSRRFRRSRR